MSTEIGRCGGAGSTDWHGARPIIRQLWNWNQVEHILRLKIVCCKIQRKRHISATLFTSQAARDHGGEIPCTMHSAKLGHDDMEPACGLPTEALPFLTTIMPTFAGKAGPTYTSLPNPSQISQASTTPFRNISPAASQLGLDLVGTSVYISEVLYLIPLNSTMALMTLYPHQTLPTPECLVHHIQTSRQVCPFQSANPQRSLALSVSL